MAIALVPPLAATGVGLKMQNLLFASRAFSIALINLLAVLVSGSFSLKILGFGPSSYYKKKSAEEMQLAFPVSMILMLLAMIFLLLRPY